MFRTVNYRYRVFLTPAQAEYMNALLGACRATYNTFLYETELEYKRKIKAEEFGLPFKQKTMNQIVSQVTAFGKQPAEKQWLRKYPAWTIQQAANDAKQAYQNWWKNKAYSKPRYKKRDYREGGARFQKPPNGEFSVEKLNRKKSRVFLNRKIGWVKFNQSRKLPSSPSSLTITRESTGKYYISFVVQQPIKPAKTEGEALSADLGLTDLLVWTRTSGERGKIPAARNYRRAERKLKKLQKEYSRKQKDSKNQEKARQKLAVAHEKVRYTRQDQCRKIASRIASETQVVILETLSAAGMVRNHYLAKSVSDAAFGLLVQAIENACEREGVRVIRLDRWQPTTKVCSQCGVIREKVPLNVREWQCEHCFAVLDRDFNAAVNMLLAGGISESQNACGENIRELALVDSSLGEARTRQRTHATEVVGV